MQRLLKLLFVAAFTTSLAATSVFAHAFLDHAIPGVGMTVSGPVLLGASAILGITMPPM